VYLSDAAEFGRLLGFTPEWYTLGIVDDGLLGRMRSRWDSGKDPNTEHYRYWAFGEFLRAHTPLSPDLALALYELGNKDVDQGMGGAMMANIVYRPDCPESVLEAAARSGRRHLVRAVGNRARRRNSG
jgi:hypothetical protein